MVKRQTKPYPYAWVLTDTTYFFLAGGTMDRNRYPYLVADRADAEDVRGRHRGALVLADIIILGPTCSNQSRAT